MKPSSLGFALLLALGASACNKGKMTPAPPPLRPPAQEAPAKPVVAAEATDCPEPRPLEAKPSLKYTERSITEAEKLAREGVAKLASAETPGIDKLTRESAITDAVETFINALLADPYNVNATYNLAASYARIDRRQCSINMLERVIQMREHPSKREQVDAKLDRLLGRNKQSLDPDFNDMRGDARFRQLIQKMCGGTDDPGCVFGN